MKAGVLQTIRPTIPVSKNAKNGQGLPALIRRFLLFVKEKAFQKAHQQIQNISNCNAVKKGLISEIAFPKRIVHSDSKARQAEDGIGDHYQSVFAFILLPWMLFLRIVLNLYLEQMLSKYA